MSNLLRNCLQTYITQQRRLELYLQNGIRLTGTVLASDQSTLLFSTHGSRNYQLVYLQAIATLQEVDPKGLPDYLSQW